MVICFKILRRGLFFPFFNNTEIGVRIRLVDEETKKYCEKLENEIWRKFQDTRSESTLELRNKLHEVGSS